LHFLTPCLDFFLRETCDARRCREIFDSLKNPRGFPGGQRSGVRATRLVSSKKVDTLLPAWSQTRCRRIVMIETPGYD
jgi:hypothetical protein